MQAFPTCKHSDSIGIKDGASPSTLRANEPWPEAAKRAGRPGQRYIVEGVPFIISNRQTVFFDSKMNTGNVSALL